MNQNIYEINQEHEALVHELELLISDNEPDLAKLEAIQEALAINEGELKAKAQSYVYIIQQKEQRHSFLKSEEKRIKALAAREKKVIDDLKGRVTYAMTSKGLKSLELDHHRLIVRGSEKIMIDEGVKPGDLPRALVNEKTVIEFNKTAIKKAIKAGNLIQGASLVSSKSLQIK